MAESVRVCGKCGQGEDPVRFDQTELRPFGKDGGLICFGCGMRDYSATLDTFLKVVARIAGHSYVSVDGEGRIREIAQGDAGSGAVVATEGDVRRVSAEDFRVLLDTAGKIPN